jgi:hypothetical protein
VSRPSLPEAIRIPIATIEFTRTFCYHTLVTGSKPSLPAKRIPTSTNLLSYEYLQKMWDSASKGSPTFEFLLLYRRQDSASKSSPPLSYGSKEESFGKGYTGWSNRVIAVARFRASSALSFTVVPYSPSSDWGRTFVSSGRGNDSSSWNPHRDLIVARLWRAVHYRLPALPYSGWGYRYLPQGTPLSSNRSVVDCNFVLLLLISSLKFWAKELVSYLPAA